MSSCTRIVTRWTPSGIAFADLAAGQFLSPRAVGARSGSAATVALVGLSMMLLGGDDVRIEIVVGAGTHLRIIEPAAMVAYSSDGATSSYRVSIRVEPEASLCWEAAPVVVCASSHVVRHIVADVEPDASVTLAETLVFGRTGERAGAIDSTTIISRGSEGPWVRERINIPPEGASMLTLPPRSKAMSTLITTQAIAEDEETRSIEGGTVDTFLLPRLGCMVRATGDNAHSVSAEVEKCLPQLRSRFDDQVLAGHGI